VMMVSGLGPLQRFHERHDRRVAALWAMVGQGNRLKHVSSTQKRAEAGHDKAVDLLGAQPASLAERRISAHEIGASNVQAGSLACTLQLHEDVIVMARMWKAWRLPPVNSCFCSYPMPH
jgi:hypothetical protein